MSKNNRQSGGWDFETGGSDSTAEEPVDASQFEIQQPILWVHKNVRSVFGITAVIAAFLAFLIFAPNTSSTPAYDVPGGEIELIGAEQVDKWLLVTGRVAERLKKEHRPVNPSGELFTYYHILGKRKDLKLLITSICKKEQITFEEYREITHEIALTNPFKTIDGDSVQVEVTQEGSTDEKQRRIQRNREVLSEKFSRFQFVWNNLHKSD